MAKRALDMDTTLSLHNDEPLAKRPRRVSLDDLDRALKTLEQEQNILGRPNFACCGSCGACAGELLLKNRTYKNKRGIVYYTKQRSGRVLYLNYGANPALEKNNETRLTEEVAHVLVEHLARAGIPAEWNGEPGQCVQVTAIDTEPEIMDGTGDECACDSDSE